MDDITDIESAFRQEQVRTCRCHKCCDDFDIRSPYGTRWQKFQMITCPLCGNKRCPKASDHRNKCTRSNATGQAGSIYE